MVGSAGSRHTVIFAFFFSYSAVKAGAGTAAAFPQNY